MKAILTTTTLVASLFCAPLSAESETYTTLFDFAIGDDIGWSQYVFVDDINQDGNNDVLLLLNGDVGVYYLGAGNGTLSGGTWFTTEFSSASTRMLEDFNGDGYPDVYKSAFYPGGGGLAYDVRVNADAAISSCIRLTPVDFNRDGLPDLVCAADQTTPAWDKDGYGMLLYKNTGNFSFTLHSSQSFSDDHLSTVEAQYADDINNDGIKDIVQIVRHYTQASSGYATRTEFYTVTSYHGQSANGYVAAGTFKTDALQDTSHPWGSSRIKEMRLSDTNNDGNLDVVALGGTAWTTESPGFVAVFFGDGNGAFNPQPQTTALASPRASDFDIADMDFDGNVDLIISYDKNNDTSEQLETTVSYGLGNGHFGATVQLSAQQETIWAMDIGNLNGDTRPDIVTIAGWNTGGRLLGYSLQNSGFQPQATPVCQYTTSDPDGDGWGWENAASCLVTDESSTTTPANLLLVRNPAVPLCSSAATDPDDDGWGWENNASCQVASRVDTSLAQVTARPICEKPWRDYDGDGWGYENGRSCIAIRD